MYPSATGALTHFNPRSRRSLATLALLLGSCITLPRSVPAAEPEAANAELGEVVVTARRREENLQSVPVAINAFSGDALQREAVVDVQDLNSVVPGFHFGGEGGKAQFSIVQRGLTQTPLGEGTPAVVVYFDEVPIASKGSNIPLYDLANLQVLKGPQGTLFGRNTLGGAILIAPQQPSYDFGGYASASYGNYNERTFEGAINLPIVDGHWAARLSGQIRRRDGVTKNLSGGPDFDDVDQNSFRAILLGQPVEQVKNTLMFDFFHADEQPAGNYLLKALPGAIPGLSPLIDAGVADYVAEQRAAGFHSAFTDLAPDAGRAYRQQWVIQDKAEVQLDGITIKNIFGYRRADAHHTLGISGTGPVDTAFGPFYIYSGDQVTARSYLTEELQALGKAFDDKLSWITGVYYEKQKPTGLNGTALETFTFVPGFTPYSTSLVTNQNFSVFSQGGLDLSSLARGLSVDLGVRYSWDKVSACGGGDPTHYLTPADCDAIAAKNLPDGTGVVTDKGNAPSWTVGLNYQATDDLFLYVVTRRGYRGVNVNTPLFETPYTTGKTIVPAAPGAPGCTGPGNACPDLRPYQTTKAETVTDVEIGAKSEWRVGGAAIIANVAAYTSKYKNGVQLFNVIGTGLYSAAPDYPTQSSVAINAADQTISGVELDLSAKITPDLRVSLNGAYNHARIDRVIVPNIAGLTLTKDQITLPTPTFAGGASLEWTLPVRLLQGSLVYTADYFYTEKFGAQFGNDLPGYELTNMRLDWRDIGGSKVSLGAYVRNLFQEQYFTGAVVLSPGFPVNTALLGDPRTFGVQARVEF
jgi:iron complex outermembrane receptor protein